MPKKQLNTCFFPLWILFLPILFYTLPVNAQQITEGQIKAAYVYNFLKTVDWPNDGSQDTYTIEILGNDTDLITWLQKMESLKVKNKSIRVTVCLSVESISSPNLLVICKSMHNQVKDIFDRIKGKSILLVTDQYQYQRYTMINFISNNNGKVQFQINSRNLEGTEILNTSKLVLLGGSEIDVRKLYQESEQSLVLEKEKSSLYQKDLEQKIEEIRKAIAELDDLNQQLIEQQAKIEIQKKELFGLGTKFEEQKLKLDEKNRILKEQQAKIEQKELLLKEEQHKLHNMQYQVEEYTNILQGQETEIEKRQLIIDDQDKALSNHLNIISTQKSFLYFLTVLILFIVALAILVLQNFLVIRKKKQQIELVNSELNIKNEELNTSRQEILQQKDELETTLTNLKETQQKLIQSEKMASIGTLTAGVAHEINNPLNYIMGAKISLENYFNENQSADKTTTDFIQQAIAVGIGRIAGIVNGLEQFSRNNNSLEETCKIHEIIDNCLTMLQGILSGKVDLVKEYEKTELAVKGNIGRLHQAFLNILVNAVDAIPDKGTIRLKTSILNTFAVIELIDSGIGIDPKYLMQITDPFFTTKDPGKGTGLGLSIAYSIFTEINGSMKFNSDPGRGTSVLIKLPVIN
jgi:signal transduction histidine kinase